jgi:hypothetical protein
MEIGTVPPRRQIEFDDFPVRENHAKGSWSFAIAIQDGVIVFLAAIAAACESC